jgi:hypothetical protein
MLLTFGIGLLSLASALFPALGLLALYVLAETWRSPINAPGWFRTAYRLSRYYVFTVLVIALLWLLAAVLVINTDFWSVYDPEADADPMPALEHALQHWEEIDLVEE